MPSKNSPSLLIKEKFRIADDKWAACLSESRNKSVSLIRCLVEKGLADEEGLLNFLSQELNIPFQRIKPEDIDPEVISGVPAKLVTHYNFMPLKLLADTLQIAIADPLDLLSLDEIRLFLNRPLALVIAPQKDIIEAIKNFYGLGAETLEAMAIEAPEKLEVLGAQQGGSDIKDETIDPSVIKFINQVLLDAIKQRSTDIHFEPFEDDLRVRYRIDGILYEVSCPPTIKQFQPSIASRIKVMAKLDIAEKRRPQDGRIEIKMEQEVFDLRISVIPTPFGESIGIRILSRSSPIIGLEGLGLQSHELVILEKSIIKSHGIILVTGPTGSGKTTTLYACLNKINSPQRKILTIEDPIEYQLKGITQMQVEPKTGFTFANALRSMLRHDPNIMMVGEIRDTETAELAVRTALTGHLVFSTLHTNDASGAITRLLDMGVDPFLVSSSVILIIAQRLVRIICPECKQKANDSYKGSGCETCRFTGYQGRTAIFEMLPVSDEIREEILKKSPSHQIKQKAVALGMRVLRDAGWDKVKQGITTVDEVLRVTQEEET